MRTRLLAVGFFAFFTVAILVFIDQLARHFDDGAFPLRVDLISKSDRRINRVSVSVLLDKHQADDFETHPDRFVLDPVNRNPGLPFEVRVIFGGEYSGFGRELSYGQARFLALAVEYADGNKACLTAEIPNHRRELTVEVP